MAEKPKLSLDNKKPVFVDLFAGCGGMSLGLEKAGFIPIYVNEINEDAMATYLINRKVMNPLLEEKYHSFDIKELVESEENLKKIVNGFKEDYLIDADKGEIDLIIGGPPCQGFSGIGIRRNYAVDRNQLPSNHLYKDMSYVINYLHPKIFLFENVRGLLTARWTKTGEKGEIWKDVYETFESLQDYQINYSLVYSKDYGVPQNRPRILLVGIRNDVGMPNIDQSSVANGFLPNPTNDYPNLIDLLGDLVDENYVNGGSTDYYPYEPRNEIQLDLRRDPFSNRVLQKGDKLTEHKYSKHSSRIIEKFTYMIGNNGDIPEILRTNKFSQRLLPKKWDENGPNITATSIPDDYLHYKQPRTLTVREWARLQLFPDWYVFCGKRTTGGIQRAGNPRSGNYYRELPKYTQIGNAVPVKLAFEIGLHFRKLLER